MNLFITGGTGYFGKHFIKQMLKKFKKINVYSRNEYLQWKLIHDIRSRKLSCIIGDIKDRRRLIRKMAGNDVVIHAAALKHVSVCEDHPNEAMEINSIGTRNVIDAVLANNIKAAILISTDKAVKPINCYGMTKHLAEKKWINANKEKAIFKVIRGGNMMGSSGSVLEIYHTMLKNRNYVLPLTDERVTRYWMNTEDMNKTVYDSIKGPVGLYIPPMKGFRILDLIKALNASYKVTGLTEGEKLHEWLNNEKSSSWREMTVRDIKNELKKMGLLNEHGRIV